MSPISGREQRCRERDKDRTQQRHSKQDGSQDSSIHNAAKKTIVGVTKALMGIYHIAEIGTLIH